jgi:hypothetical protein
MRCLVLVPIQGALRHRHHGAHVADRFVFPCSVLKVKDFGFKVNKESELQDA